MQGKSKRRAATMFMLAGLSVIAVVLNMSAFIEGSARAVEERPMLRSPVLAWDDKTGFPSAVLFDEYGDNPEIPIRVNKEGLLSSAFEAHENPIVDAACMRDSTLSKHARAVVSQNVERTAGETAKNRAQSTLEKELESMDETACNALIATALENYEKWVSNDDIEAAINSMLATEKAHYYEQLASSNLDESERLISGSIFVKMPEERPKCRICEETLDTASLQTIDTASTVASIEPKINRDSVVVSQDSEALEVLGVDILDDRLEAIAPFGENGEELSVVVTKNGEIDGETDNSFEISYRWSPVVTGFEFDWDAEYEYSCTKYAYCGAWSYEYEQEYQVGYEVVVDGADEPEVRYLNDVFVYSGKVDVPACNLIQAPFAQLPEQIAAKTSGTGSVSSESGNPMRVSGCVLPLGVEIAETCKTPLVDIENLFPDKGKLDSRAELLEGEALVYYDDRAGVSLEWSGLEEGRNLFCSEYAYDESMKLLGEPKIEQAESFRVEIDPKTLAATVVPVCAGSPETAYVTLQHGDYQVVWEICAQVMPKRIAVSLERQPYRTKTATELAVLNSINDNVRSRVNECENELGASIDAGYFSSVELKEYDRMGAGDQLHHLGDDCESVLFVPKAGSQAYSNYEIEVTGDLEISAIRHLSWDDADLAIETETGMATNADEAQAVWFDDVPRAWSTTYDLCFDTGAVPDDEGVFAETIELDADEGEHEFNLYGVDRETRELVKIEGLAFKLDRLAPEMVVEFDNNNATNGIYYNAPRLATITVREKNFDESLMAIEVTSEAEKGEEAGDARVGAWTSRENVHVATVEFPGEGAYSLSVYGSDRSGRDVVPFEQPKFIVDTVAPKVEVTGVGKNGAYAGKAQPAVIVADTNIDKGAVSVTLDKSGHPPFGVESINPYKSTTKEGDSRIELAYCDAQHDAECDGVYSLNVRAVDMAGNESTSSATWSVNRFGSTYLLSDDTKALLGKCVQPSKLNEVEIVEINPSGFDETQTGVEIVRDAVNERLEPGSELEIIYSHEQGWNTCTYRIGKDAFSGDGIYQVLLHSKDYADNVSENTMPEKDQTRTSPVDIRFAVDGTPPIASFIGLESGVIYEGAGHEAVLVAEDNIGLDSAELYVDQECIVSLGEQDFGRAKTHAFEVHESARPQNVRAVVRDLAGNETRIVADDIRVVSARFAAPAMLAAGMLVAVFLVAAIATVLHSRTVAQHPRFRENPYTGTRQETGKRQLHQKRVRHAEQDQKHNENRMESHHPRGD